jgi:hypothetical protein
MNIEDRRFTKIWAGCIRLKMIGKSVKMKDVGGQGRSWMELDAARRPYSHSKTA